MELLDGKKISEQIKEEITAEVLQMKANGEKVPHLAAIIVGNDGASLTYVGSKVKACERVGFESTLIKMPSTTSETELLKQIKKRGRNIEQNISPVYLAEIQEAYLDYLKTETETPVLILELGDADFQRDTGAFSAIVAVIAKEHPPGPQFLKL